MRKNLITKKGQPESYFEYLRYIKKNQTNFSIKTIEHYFKRFSLLATIIDSLPCVVYILDYRTRKYLFMSKNCIKITGYTSEEHMEKGQEFTQNCLHPDDFKVFYDDVFTNFLAFTRTLKKQELEKTRFSVNFRSKRKDGVYIHALQQYSVLETNDDGYPILTLGSWTDISAHKSDNKVVFSISKYDNENGFSVISTDSFPHAKLMITERESEVIKHLIRGLVSKQIADKLKISLHTVNAHRRNLLEKTKCKNTAELISYALENGVV